MSLDISAYSVEQKYEFLNALVGNAQNHFNNTSNDKYAFKTAEGEINLIALRGFKDGKPCKSSNQSFDDTLFAAYIKNGEKKVDEFKLSTEFGNKGTGLLMPGQHSFYLNYHKKSKPHQSLADSPNYPSGKQYRALNPYGSQGASILRDANRDFVQNGTESLEWSTTHNIHYGGNGSNPQAWSEGCQVIQGWQNYKDFIELIESDHSIFGTSNNELAPKNTTNDGNRPLIYTLINGQDLESEGSLASRPEASKARFLPPLRDKEIKALFDNNVTGRFGQYLIGSNRHWHGGVHFTLNQPIQAIADGKLVAYRLGQENIHHFFGEGESRSSKTYSHSFVLLKHEYKVSEEKTFTYFSLYMHLQPFNAYSLAPNRAIPAFLMSNGDGIKRATINTSEDTPKGLNLRDLKTGAVRAVAPIGSILATDNTTYPENETTQFRAKSTSNSDYKAVKFTDHNGVTHSKVYALLDSTRAKLDGANYRVQTQEDALTPSAERALKGLNLRSEMNYQANTIVGVVAKNTQVELKIIDDKWAEVKTIDDEAPPTSCYISYSGKVVFSENKLNEDIVNQVICPESNILIKAGDLLGYPSDNLLQKNCVHFEVFCAPSEKSIIEHAFLKTQQNLYHLKVGTRLHLEAERTAISGSESLPMLAKVEIQQSDSQYSKVVLKAYAGLVQRSHLGTYTSSSRTYAGVTSDVESYTTFNGKLTSTSPVKFAAFSRSASEFNAGTQSDNYRLVVLALAEAEQKTFWIAKSELSSDATFSISNQGTFLKKSLSNLLTEDPSKPVLKPAEGITQKHDAWFDKANCRSFKDASGESWIGVSFAPEVDKKWIDPLQHAFGLKKEDLPTYWVKESDLTTTAALNFPGFSLAEDDSDDPYIDFEKLAPDSYFKKLLQEIDTSGDKIIDDNELDKAMRDGHSAEKLARIIAKHPTEWHYTDEKWQHLDTLITDETMLEQAKKHIKHLAWWNEVKPELLPSPTEVYHFNPLAFYAMISTMKPSELINAEAFLTEYKALFGSINTQSEANILSLIKEINGYYQENNKAANLYQMAYMLATGRKESYYFPKAEYFSDKPEVGNYSYFNKYDPVLAETATLKARAKNNGNVNEGDGYKYRGRGMVHLTWFNNYQKAANALSVDFVSNPDFAGQHKYAVAIMVWGMEGGHFTGKKLSDYINASKIDYKNARRITNGTDCADEIAGNAKKFEQILSKTSTCIKEFE